MNNKPHFVDLYAGQQVRIARSLLNMSQSDLAEKLEISFQQVQKYENGSNRISASRLFEIAEILKQPISYFFPIEKDIKNDDVELRSRTIAVAAKIDSIKIPALRDHVIGIIREVAS